MSDPSRDDPQASEMAEPLPDVTNGSIVVAMGKLILVVGVIALPFAVVSEARTGDSSIAVFCILLSLAAIGLGATWWILGLILKALATR